MTKYSSFLCTATEKEEAEKVWTFGIWRRYPNCLYRIQSSATSTEDGQGPKAPTENHLRTSAQESARRGTTGMVQRLESCHIKDIDGDHRPGSCRSGSLPIAPQATNTNDNTNPNQQFLFPSPSFSLSGLGNASSQFLPFAPFMSVPWWLDPNMQLQDNSIIQDDGIPVQSEDMVAKKRKHDGDPEQPTSHPIQRSQAKQLSPEINNFSGIDRMDMLHLDIFSNPTRDSTLANPPNISSMATSMHNFSWNPSSNINQGQGLRRYSPPTTVLRRPSVAEQLWPSHYTSQQNPNLRTNQTSNAQQQTVTIPAALAPDQSVSPRTQTVEVPKLPSSSQPQARQVRSQHAMVPNDLFQPSSQQPRAMVPMYLNNQFQIPRSTPPWSGNRPAAQRSQQDPTLNRPQQLMASSSDIMRKPSLYKVPPWPLSAPFFYCGSIFFGSCTTSMFTYRQSSELEYEQFAFNFQLQYLAALEFNRLPVNYDAEFTKELPSSKINACNATTNTSTIIPARIAIHPTSTATKYQQAETLPKSVRPFSSWPLAHLQPSTNLGFS